MIILVLDLNQSLTLTLSTITPSPALNKHLTFKQIIGPHLEPIIIPVFVSPSHARVCTALLVAIAALPPRQIL